MAISSPITANCGMNCSTGRSSILLNRQKILIEQWRKEYNQIRPNSSLKYQPPAPKARLIVATTQQMISLIGASQINA